MGQQLKNLQLEMLLVYLMMKGPKMLKTDERFSVNFGKTVK